MVLTANHHSNNNNDDNNINNNDNQPITSINKNNNSGCRNAKQRRAETIKQRRVMPGPETRSACENKMLIA